METIYHKKILPEGYARVASISVVFGSRGQAEGFLDNMCRSCAISGKCLGYRGLSKALIEGDSPTLSTLQAFVHSRGSGEKPEILGCSDYRARWCVQTTLTPYNHE
jgi:hypothetical protein